MSEEKKEKLPKWFFLQEYECDFRPPYTIAAHPKVIENLKKTKWWKLFKKS